MSGARWIGGAPEPIAVSDGVAIALLVAVELASATVVVRMWRGRGPIVSRLVWTFVTLVPVLGLIAHLVWRDPPPPRGPTDGPRGHGWDLPPEP